MVAVWQDGQVNGLPVRADGSPYCRRQHGQAMVIIGHSPREFRSDRLNGTLADPSASATFAQARSFALGVVTLLRDQFPILGNDTRLS